MFAVGGAAIVCWRRTSELPWKWLWIGAGLWAVAGGLKVSCALFLNPPVIKFLAREYSAPVLLVAGGAFLGFESAFFEIGLTCAAVAIWRHLGGDAGRATGVGAGAGAVEAVLLAIASLAAVAVCLSGTPAGAKVAEQMAKTAESTPLAWLVPPSERAIALLCHTASRTLVLLGVTHGKPLLILCGWLLFTLIDGVARAFHLTGRIGQFSLWWIELALLPFALISIPPLRWSWSQWPPVPLAAQGSA